MREIFWRNLLWLGSTTILSMVASFLCGILVARYLGPTGFGRFALVVGVGSMLTSVAQGSGSTALVVMVAKDAQRAREWVWPGVAVQASVGVLATLLSLPLVYLLSWDTALIRPAVIYGCANLAVLLLSVPVSIYRGLDRMEWGAAYTAASWGILLLTIAVVILDLGFEATLAAIAVSQLAIVAVAFPWASRSLRVTGWVPGLTSRLWSTSLALLVVTLVQALHWRTGTLTVQAFGGSYQLGVYSAAAKLIENLRTIPWFLLMAILPAFVQMGQSDRDKLRTLLHRAMRWILLLVFPFAAILAILSPLVIGFLYTPEYAVSALVLRLCALGLVPLFVHWVFLNGLVAMRMERELIFAYLVSIVVEVALNRLLVPMWGVNGAAVGYVVGETVVALVCGLYVVRALGALKWDEVWRSALPGALALALVGFSPAGARSLCAWAVAVCVLYAFGVFILRAITLSELRDLVRLR